MKTGHWTVIELNSNRPTQKSTSYFQTVGWFTRCHLTYSQSVGSREEMLPHKIIHIFNNNDIRDQVDRTSSSRNVWNICTMFKNASPVVLVPFSASVYDLDV